MAPREAENNAYAKCWGDQQRALCYVMVFSGVINLTLGNYANEVYCMGTSQKALESQRVMVFDFYCIHFLNRLYSFATVRHVQDQQSFIVAPPSIS